MYAFFCVVISETVSCVLFYYDVCRLIVAPNGRMIHARRIRKMWKWPWSTGGTFPDICLEGLRKPKKDPIECPGRDRNRIRVRSGTAPPTRSL
jgi:hypothetical protein